MSKKTDAIYSSLDKLDSLIKGIKDGVVNFDAKGEKGEFLKTVDDSCFEMENCVRELRFWIGSLYSYNGKSKSRAKKAASQLNGKKGGRPPKEITTARRKIKELEEIIIPDFESKMRLSVSGEDEEAFRQRLNAAQTELASYKETVEAYEKSKNSLGLASQNFPGVENLDV